MDHVHELLARRWDELDLDGAAAEDRGPALAWSFRPSPPLPLSWPPHEDGRWAVYGMPWRFDPSIADGERVARPFARVVAGDELVVEDLAGALVEAGVVGRRPLEPEELATGVDTSTMVRACRDGSVDPSPVRALYRQWFASTGEPGREVAERHRAVERWAAAPGGTPRRGLVRRWRRRPR